MEFTDEVDMSMVPPPRSIFEYYNTPKKGILWNFRGGDWTNPETGEKFIHVSLIDGWTAVPVPKEKGFLSVDDIHAYLEKHYNVEDFE